MPGLKTDLYIIDPLHQEFPDFTDTSIKPDVASFETESEIKKGDLLQRGMKEFYEVMAILHVAAGKRTALVRKTTHIPLEGRYVYEVKELSISGDERILSNHLSMSIPTLSELVCIFPLNTKQYIVVRTPYTSL